MKNMGMEKVFLKDWEDWDEVDTFSICFYNPVLRDDVDFDLTDYEKSILNSVTIDMQQGVLEIWFKDSTFKTYNLALSLAKNN